MKQQQFQEGQIPVYNKLWFRILALTLALIMIFSIWANGAIQVKIRKEYEQDAAAQYLIDNTDYVQAGELGRLEDKIQTYFQPTTLEDFYRLAGTQIGAGEYAEALESIEQCLALCSGENPALQMDLLLKKACLYVLLEQYEQAVAALEQVLLEDPEQSDAYLVLAQIYAESGNYEGLIPVLEEYLKLKPEDGDIRMVLAQVLFETGMYAQAAQEYRDLRMRESLPENREQLQFLEALTYIQMEEYASAKALLLELSGAESTISDLDYYLGVCTLSEEDYENGEKLFTASLEAAQMIQLSHYSRAVCRLMKADFDLEGAITDLESVISYAGADADPDITRQAQGLLDTILTQDAER